MNFKALSAKLGLEEKEFQELMELFVHTGALDLAGLRAGLADGDADRVMRRAHTLKGASGNLGLAEISAMADTIEQHALNHRLDEAAQALQVLMGRFEAIRSEIQVHYRYRCHTS
jgi:histidine phosphotransfer protein HptB